MCYFFPNQIPQRPSLTLSLTDIFSNLTVCIWLPFCALWKEKCLFLSVFITSPHSSAVIRLSDSDVFLRFQHIPWLSLTLQTKILQHMHKERWHRSLLFPVQRVHPCLTITNCSCTFLPSFLPSFLVDLWPDKLGRLPWRQAFFICGIQGLRVWTRSQINTVTDLHPWKTPCGGRETPGGRGSGYRILSRRPTNEYLDT